MADTKPQKIYNATDRALVVLTDAHDGDHVVTSRSVVLQPGDTLEITPEIVAANADRTGFSWLSLTEDEQRDKWGRLRFGYGEPSPEVRARVALTRRDQLLAERDDLLSGVPRSADRRRYLSKRVDAIDAELAEIEKLVAA